MPVYDYECRICGNRFTERRPIDERYDIACERCGAQGEDGVGIRLGTPHVTWVGGPPTLPNLGRTMGRGAPNKPSDDEIADGILGPDGEY